MAISYEYFGQIEGIHYIKFWNDAGKSFTRKFQGTISDIDTFANNFINNKIIPTIQAFQDVKVLEGNVYTHNGVNYGILDTRFERGMIYVYLQFNYNSNNYYKRLALDTENTLQEVNQRIKARIDQFVGGGT